MREKTDPRILKYLKKCLKGKVSEKTIPPAISRIRRKNPSLTLNAAAEIYATKQGLSVQRFFNDRDRDAFKTITLEKIKITAVHRTQRKISIIASYPSNDHLLKAHIDEINKTYTYACYTSTFILCRKVLENLLIHHVLIKKYPPKIPQNKVKYLENNGRFLTFRKILSNLRKSSNDFVAKKQLVERICDLADQFKDDANNMTHSWYHLATKKEIDATNFQQILDLVAELEKSVV